MKDDSIGRGKKREATSRTVKIQVNDNTVCNKMHALRWAAFIRILEFYLLPLVIVRVEHPEIVHISRYVMLTSELCADSERLTSDAWIVKSTEEHDIVLPQCHSRYGLFKKKTDKKTKARKSNLCPERADGRTLVSIRSHECVMISKHQKSR
jgi:hypothetical protein